MTSEQNKPVKTKTAKAAGKKLKITLVITDLDLNLDSAGCAVQLEIAIENAKVIAPVNPKSFRKAQAAVKAAIEADERDNVVVLLSGELDLAAKKIINAGIVAQPRTPKQKEVDTTVSEAAAVLAPSAQEVPVATSSPSENAEKQPVVVYKKVRQVLIPD